MCKYRLHIKRFELQRHIFAGYSEDNMGDYTPGQVYEDAYRNECKWEKWLPKEVYEYHSMIWREINASVDLQMGVLLPFVASVCGPKTRSSFLTQPSVINLFWINVAASGVGKSQSRKRMISHPLSFILKHMHGKLVDFEVSKYTRAG